MSKTTNKFAPEVRERAVRIVFDRERDHPSRWAAVVSIAEKIRYPARPWSMFALNPFYQPAQVVKEKRGKTRTVTPAQERDEQLQRIAQAE